MITNIECSTTKFLSTNIMRVDGRFLDVEHIKPAEFREVLETVRPDIIGAIALDAESKRDTNIQRCSVWVLGLSSTLSGMFTKEEFQAFQRTKNYVIGPELDKYKPKVRPYIEAVHDVDLIPGIGGWHSDASNGDQYCLYVRDTPWDHSSFGV